jgi:hypothetical protein
MSRRNGRVAGDALPPRTSHAAEERRGWSCVKCCTQLGGVEIGPDLGRTLCLPTVAGEND